MCSSPRGVANGFAPKVLLYPYFLGARGTFGVEGLGCLPVRPEDRLDILLIHFVDEHHEVVAEDFAQDFIVHRGLCSAAKRTPEQTFHGTERGLDIRPQMIAFHIFARIALEAVLHRLEGAALATIGVDLKGDVWSRTQIDNRFHVFP